MVGKSFKWIGGRIEWGCPMDRSFAICYIFAFGVETVGGSHNLCDSGVGVYLLEVWKASVVAMDTCSDCRIVGYSSVRSLLSMIVQTNADTAC